MENDNFSNDDDPTKQVVPLFHLLIALLCPMIAMLLSYLMKINLEKRIFTVISRMIVQLLFAGYVLLGYLFQTKSPYIILAYLVFITIMAAVESRGRLVRTYKEHSMDSLIALFFGGTFIGLIFSVLTFNPKPWWDPRVVVTSVGMFLGNAISGPSVCIDIYLALVSDQKHMVDTRLSFGSTGYESVLPFVRQSISASFIPMLNRMSVVGIVSVPGIMAGQLLGGASPLVAAEYQMIIFWILCGTATFSIYISVFLAIFHATIDSNHRLTIHRIIKISKSNLSFDKIIYKKVNELIEYFKIKYHNLANSELNTKKSTSYEMVSSNDEHHSSHDDVNTSNKDIEKNDKITSKDIEANLTSDLLYTVSYDVITNIKNISNDPTLLTIESINLIVNDIPLFDPSTGLNLTIKKGERISIEGPSGIGKTRLLRVLSKLDDCVNGRLILNNQQIITDDNSINNSSQTYTILCKHWKRCLQFLTSCDLSIDIPLYRRQVMYIPQALPPMSQTPKAFLKECLNFESRKNLSLYTNTKNNLVELCKTMEVKLGLLEGKLSEEWGSLSGGERQRAIIGCALILSNINDTKNVSLPIVLLLDEPTAACDTNSCALVEKALIESNITIILITHDSSQAQRLCHRRLILSSMRR